MVSAFWHGFYAGYYFSFFLWFAQVYVQTQIFKRSKNDNSKFTRLYNKLGRFSTLIAVFSSVLFSHNATFFVLLRASLCIKFMERVYYIPQLLLPLGIIYLAFLPKKKQSQNSVKSGEH
jgi:lysophospholipid acyltransferase